MSGRWSAWGLVVLLGIIWVGVIQAAEPDSLEGCRAQPFDAKMQCYQRHLETVLQAEGTEQALTVLEQITVQDPRRCGKPIRLFITSANVRLRTTARRRLRCRIAATCFGQAVTMGSCRRSSAVFRTLNHSTFCCCVLARTGIDSDRDHRLHHDEGLEVLERLGRRIADAAKAHHPGHRDAILDALQEFRRHAHTHFDRHDTPLWRHTGLLSGIAVAAEANPSLP